MNANVSTRHLNYIDYGKVFCIFYVLMVHSGFSSLNNAVAFCMPFFFFVAGMNFNPDKRNLRELAAARFKQLIIPYWLLIMFYNGVDAARLKIFGTGYVLGWKATLSNLLYGSFILPDFPFFTNLMKGVINCPADPPNVCISPTNCHLWFLPAMFSASIIFALLAPKFKKEFSAPKFVLAVFALLCLASLEVHFRCLNQLPWGLGRGFYAAAIMLSGFCLRRHAPSDALDLKKRPLLFAFLAAAYLLTIPLHSHGALIIRSIYGDYGVASLFISSIGGACGAAALLMLMKQFDDLRGGREIKLLGKFGKNTLWIYGLHFFFFFLVELVYFTLGGKFQPDRFYMDLIPNSGIYLLVNLVQVAAAFFGGLYAAKLWYKTKERFR